MNTVIVRGLAIGDGQPKICVPITGRNRVEIMNQLEGMRSLPFDIIEWRTDFFEELNDMIAIKELLLEINNVYMDKPILFTFRTSMEGGQRWIPVNQYTDLIYTAVGSGVVDIVDIELFLGDKFVENMIMQAHRMGVKALVSNHDFMKTPTKDKIVDRLKNMAYLGADIAKIAVMPKDMNDVFELMQASIEASQKMIIPVATMSMGELGIITRTCGEVTNSALTFGAGVVASAPGQIPVQDLNTIISTIHRNIGYNSQKTGW